MRAQARVLAFDARRARACVCARERFARLASPLGRMEVLADLALVISGHPVGSGLYQIWARVLGARGLGQGLISVGLKRLTLDGLGLTILVAG